jgi:hypothetical protein
MPACAVDAHATKAIQPKEELRIAVPFPTGE